MLHRFVLNGRPVEVESSGVSPLLDVLRDDMSLTGAKRGCGEGRCGACTVLVDGAPVASCIFPTANVDGANVDTVEGLSAPDGELTPIQDALLEHGGVQCGACIPGMVMTLTALVGSGEDLDEARVRAALTGNICRCTGYQKIVDAALAVARSEGGDR